MQFFPDVVRPVLLFINQARRDDHVGVNGPQGNAQFLRRNFAPTLRLAQGIFITYDHGGMYFIAELQKAVVRIAAQYKSDAALFECRGDIGNALEQKSIGSKVWRADRMAPGQKKPRRAF